MRLQPYAKSSCRVHKGYAIIWRAIEDNGFFSYRVTFNNRSESLALEAKPHGSMQTAKQTAHDWLNSQPLKTPPKGFAFANANPRTLDGESNDCVVRALSLAFNKPYEQVHAVCQRAGRTKGRGMNTLMINKAIAELTGQADAQLQRQQRAQTFTTFARDHKVGNYVVIKRGHAIALIDGVFHDAGSVGEPRAIVKAVFKVK